MSVSKRRIGEQVPPRSFRSRGTRPWKKVNEYPYELRLYYYDELVEVDHYRSKYDLEEEMQDLKEGYWYEVEDLRESGA